MTPRLRLSRPAAERLLALSGVRPPWRAPTTPARLGPTADRAVGSADPPDTELARLGALTPAGVHPDLAAALHPFAEPEVLVDVDLVVRRGGGDAWLHSWQRPTGSAVVALSTTGDDVELAWHGRDGWPGELARLPGAAPDPVDTVPQGPRVPLTVSRQLLVATGAALRAGRGDLAAVLTHAHGPLPDAAHPHACRARLRVVVTGPDRVRSLGWVLLPDGWRDLTARRANVRLSPVDPTCLGDRVERLVNGVLR